MSGSRPQYPSDEFIQAKLEEQILEEYELHGWATAVQFLSPIDILIMIEEDEIDETDVFTTTNKGVKS